MYMYSALKKFLDTLSNWQNLDILGIQTHPMQYNQFKQNKNAWYQTIWIEDQVPRFVGPDLDPYCLQMSF